MKFFKKIKNKKDLKFYIQLMRVINLWEAQSKRLPIQLSIQLRRLLNDEIVIRESLKLEKRWVLLIN